MHLFLLQPLFAQVNPVETIHFQERLRGKFLFVAEHFGVEHDPEQILRMEQVEVQQKHPERQPVGFQQGVRPDQAPHVVVIPDDGESVL